MKRHAELRHNAPPVRLPDKDHSPMTNKTILTAGPSITQREIQYVLDAVEHGWNENHSGYIHRFEQAFAEYVGTRFALSTSSCTGALHLSLLALGVGPGDEVIVPEITWVATASAVKYVGATPVFVDIDRETWCLDPESAQRAITPRTKAIIPVHLYGHPTEMTPIRDLAKQHGLKILEDAAPALGAEVDGRKVGSLGDVAAFSFQGAKIMTCGEGGMLVTNDEMRLSARRLPCRPWAQQNSPIFHHVGRIQVQDVKPASGAGFGTNRAH